MEFKLKNATAPGYKPPATWEEFEALDRPQRIVAARYFVRKAAIRLHDFGLRPDEVISAFDAIPEWVSHQLHAYKREQAEQRKTWVCRVDECGHRGPKAEFFKPADQLTLLNELPMARCPKCGLCDAEEYVPSAEEVAKVTAKMWEKPEDCNHTYERDGLRCDKCGRLRHGTKGFQSDGSVGEELEEPEQLCDCEGQACPICKSLGENDVPVIKNHECNRCQTTLCKVCHGIKKAQLSRAYDEVRRCRCGDNDSQARRG